MRLAIVDDHPIFRAGLRQVLARANLPVAWEAGSSREAIQLLARAPADLIILDLNLGSPLEGLEAARNIVARHPRVMIVVLTALEDDGLILEALKAGASGCLSKGLSPDELLGSLRQLISGAFSRPRPVAAPHPTPAVTVERGGVVRAPHLTRREVQVLSELRTGRTNRQIAAGLGISETTVNKHVHAVLKKLNARNRTQAVLMVGSAGRTSGWSASDRQP